MNFGHMSFAIVAAILCSVISAPLAAQPADFEFATDHFVIRVCEGAEPTVLPGGFHTFTFGQDQDAESIAAELYIAAILEGCGVTSIERVIQQNLREEVLAVAIEHGVMRYYRVYVPTDTDVETVSQTLSTCPTHIEYAAPDHYGKLLGECVPPTIDPLVCGQWALHNEAQPEIVSNPDESCPITGEPEVGADVDAPEAWSLLTGSESVVIVAVIDTGADHTHPDLDGNLVSGFNFVDGPVECPEACLIPCEGPPDPECCSEEVPPFCSFPTGTGCLCDTGTHGTHMAGIICALENMTGIVGIAHEMARVKPLRVSAHVGAPETNVMEALVNAANDDDVRVINMSFFTKEGPVVDDGIDMAKEFDKLMFAAAGNDDFCQQPPDPPDCCTGEDEIVVYPARHPDVVAVGATNWLDERAVFSHVGPEIEVAAPGQNILSTVPVDPPTDCDNDGVPDTHCLFGGTSQACALTSGVAALVYSVDIDGFLPDDVRRIIKGTCDDLGPISGWDEETGCGRINAYGALLKAKCPGDLDGDCVVDVFDLIEVILSWGSCASDPCCLDIDYDEDFDVLDLVGVVDGWGACLPTCPAPTSLYQELAAVGLTPQDWQDFLDNVDDENWRCWMVHYLNGECCGTCPTCPPTCPGPDPFGRH